MLYACHENRLMMSQENFTLAKIGKRSFWKEDDDMWKKEKTLRCIHCQPHFERKAVKSSIGQAIIVGIKLLVQEKSNGLIVLTWTLQNLILTLILKKAQPNKK